MIRLSMTLALSCALALPAVPAAAGNHGQQCSESMIATVEHRMPRLNQPVNVRDLSCNGLAQLYFILTRSGQSSLAERRQQILAVFRREGLLG